MCVNNFQEEMIMAKKNNPNNPIAAAANKMKAAPVSNNTVEVKAAEVTEIKEVKAEAKAEAPKAEAKKAQKEAQKERLEKSKDKTGNVSDDDDDTVTITASSIDELLDKIQAQNQLFMSDNVQTEDEKKVGQKFDFSV